MRTGLLGKCPFCGRTFPSAQLHVHVIAEQPQTRQNVLSQIKNGRPHWSHEHGICAACWETYRIRSAAPAPGRGLIPLLDESPA